MQHRAYDIPFSIAPQGLIWPIARAWLYGQGQCINSYRITIPISDSTVWLTVFPPISKEIFHSIPSELHLLFTHRLYSTYMSGDNPLTLFFLLFIVPFPLPVSFLPCAPLPLLPHSHFYSQSRSITFPLHHISTPSHSVLSHAAPGSIVCSCGPGSYYIVSA